MKKRKIPMRKCVVTGEMRPKKSLVRIVKNKEGQLSIDESGKMPGRGAYITLDMDTAEMAMKNHSLDRALSVKVSDDFYDELVKYVEHIQIRKELFADERLFKD